MKRQGVPGISNLKAYLHAKWGGDLSAVRKVGGHRKMREMHRNHIAAMRRGSNNNAAATAKLETVTLSHRSFTQRILGRVRSVGNKLRSYITKGN